jgi:hypothetical protein
MADAGVIAAADVVPGAPCLLLLLLAMLSMLSMLLRALMNVGAALRMRRVVADLQAGKNISVGVIGGSISW